MTLYFRDWLLILILIFMAALVGSKWSEYSSCSDPLAAWLVVNFLSLLALRINQFAAQWGISGRSALAREQAQEDRSCLGSTMPRALLFTNCFLVFPFIVSWAVIGCVWYNRSHDCLPASMSGWSFIAWIILSLIMLALQGGLMLAVAKRRAWHPQSLDIEPGGCRAWMQALCSMHLLMLDHLQRLEAHALGLENDAREAAGRAGSPLNAVFLLRQPVVLVGPGQARQPGAVSTGLTPDQIAALEVRQLSPVERREQLCSICLVEFPLLPPHLDPTVSAASASASSATAAASSSSAAASDQPVWPPGSTGADDDSASASPVAASASDPLAGPAPAPALSAAAAAAAAAPEVSTNRNPSRVYSSAPVSVFALPCRHVFHTECLASWLKEEGRCPNCRQRIGPPIEELQAAAQARLEAQQRVQIAQIQAQLQAMHEAHMAAAASIPPLPPIPAQQQQQQQQRHSPEALVRLSHYQQSQMFDPSASASSSSAARSMLPPPRMSPQHSQQAPGLPSPEAPMRFTIVNLHRNPSPDGQR